MAEIINLNKRRKAKAAVDKAARADANRARFGRTKGQKASETLDAKRARRELEGEKRED